MSRRFENQRNKINISYMGWQTNPVADKDTISFITKTLLIIFTQTRCEGGGGISYLVSANYCDILKLKASTCEKLYGELARLAT